MYKRRPVGELPRRRLHQHAVRGDGRRRDLRPAQGSPRLGTTRPGPTDGSVTLEHVECNAACDYAPVMMVNWEFMDNQTPESATQLVDDLRSGQGGPLHPRPARSARGARPSGCSPGSPTTARTRVRRRPGHPGRAAIARDNGWKAPDSSRAAVGSARPSTSDDAQRSRRQPPQKAAELSDSEPRGGRHQADEGIEE